MMNNIYKMLGLSVRAGGAVFGEGASKDSLRANTSGLVIVSEDASENTKKKSREKFPKYLTNSENSSIMPMFPFDKKGAIEP